MLIAAGATLVAATGCQTQREARQPAARETTSAVVRESAAGALSTEFRTVPELRDAQLTPAELSVFAQLPARMDLPGTTPRQALIALGRALYYE